MDKPVDSGRCVGGGNICHINHNQLNRGHHIRLLPFLPVTSHGQRVLNFGVSGGCLEGIWMVSGWCLGDSGYCLGGCNVKSIEKSSNGTVPSWIFTPGLAFQSGPILTPQKSGKKSATPFLVVRHRFQKVFWPRTGPLKENPTGYDGFCALWA